MQFVWWLTGVCITIGLCKFVIYLYKETFTKENMKKLFQTANNGMQKARENISKNMKERKKKKEEEKVNKAIVTIR